MGSAAPVASRTAVALDEVAEVVGGRDNRSAMVRVPPERGSGARLELRLGGAGANPCLAIAGAVAAALLGVPAGEEPTPPLEGYGYDTDRSAVLPMSLTAALDALESDTVRRVRVPPLSALPFLR